MSGTPETETGSVETIHRLADRAKNLVGPGDGAPEISVVMVSHGAWGCTRRAIEALLAHTPFPFELIIVDNASDPGTRAQLARLPKAQVLLNDRNEGFGSGSNRGADQARADLLLFLNTDAFVTAGWVEALRETLRDPNVAAVVPQYLHPDGSLQEAGSLLAQDGSVFVYGDGDDANHPSYRFRRIIDYGGAACLFVRREVFASLGGFDPIYAPAYYEDADLGLRIAQLGMSVVYEPRAQVVHARYGSGSHKSATRMSEQNRHTFRTRWASKLRGRPWTFRGKSTQAVALARDAMASPRVLLIANPSEPHVEALLDGLLQGWPRSRLTWLTPVPVAEPIADRWLSSGVEVLAGGRCLENRLFHYDVVFRGVEIGDALPAAARRTQPQAAQFRLPDIDLAADPRSLLVPILAAAGIAPSQPGTDSPRGPALSAF